MNNVDICNLALGRIGSAKITSLADKDDVNLTNLYAQIRDKLLIQFDWNFARTRIYLTPKKYTASTIAFVNSNPDTITDSASKLITNGGFRNGDKVAVTGSTNNNNTFTIVTATEGILTLLSTDTLIAEIAGASVTLERKPAFEYDYCFQLPSDYLGNPELKDSESNFIIEGGYLFCNDDEINFVYSKQITDVTRFSGLFIECFVLTLASELAIPIANDRSLRNDIFVELQKKTLDNFMIEDYQRRDDEIQETSWQKAGR